MKDKPNLGKHREKDAQQIPRLGGERSVNKKIPIIQHQNPDEWKWNFSFKSWNQIEYFGLDKSPSKWFVSLLNKLRDLSKVNRIDVLESTAFKSAYRYHKIDWDHTNTPIARKDLSWIDKDYLENPEEYEMYQFQISLGFGRIVGFWDENWIFNIVLLDPLHNIQPAKAYSYKVDDSNILSCQYSSLLYDIQNATTIEEMKRIPTHCNETNVLVHFISEKMNSDMQELIDNGKVEKIEDILEYGIAYIKDNT